MIKRLSFGQNVEGLTNSLQGGVPQSSWVMLFGNSGAYKTLHSLSFLIDAVMNNERAVFISTEQDWRNLKLQIESLGWEYKAHEAHLTLKLLESDDFGTYDVIWIDMSSLGYLAYTLNRIVREEKEGSRKKKYYWHYDPDLLTFAIIMGLEGVGVLERKSNEITIEQVEKIRLKDGYYGSKYAQTIVNKNVTARVIIDSISALYTLRWGAAGKILTDMKIRLEIPTCTFLLTSHVPKSNEEEIGAEVGHVVDGRIMLRNELTKTSGKVRGWIAKMRLTDHSRLLHDVFITGGEKKKIKWQPITANEQ